MFLQLLRLRKRSSDGGKQSNYVYRGDSHNVNEMQFLEVCVEMVICLVICLVTCLVTCLVICLVKDVIQLRIDADLRHNSV